MTSIGLALGHVPGHDRCNVPGIGPGLGPDSGSWEELSCFVIFLLFFYSFNMFFLGIFDI